MEPKTTHARKEYGQGSLGEATVDRDLIRQFAAWYDAAVAAGMSEPEGMKLSTTTPNGHPSARVVLLRGFDARSFCFFTCPPSGSSGRATSAAPRSASSSRRWPITPTNSPWCIRCRRSSASTPRAICSSTQVLRSWASRAPRRGFPMASAASATDSPATSSCRAVTPTRRSATSGPGKVRLANGPGSRKRACGSSRALLPLLQPRWRQTRKPLGQSREDQGGAREDDRVGFPVPADMRV